MSNNSNATIRSQCLPADFSMICAGNNETIAQIHPALMSRINSYGLVVNMDEYFLLNRDNIGQYLRFITQQISKNNLKNITYEGAKCLCLISILMAPNENSMTLSLRHMAGILIAANDGCTNAEIAAKDICTAYLLKKDLASSKKLYLDISRIKGAKNFRLVIDDGNYMLVAEDYRVFATNRDAIKYFTQVIISIGDKKVLNIDEKWRGYTALKLIELCGQKIRYNA